MRNLARDALGEMPTRAEVKLVLPRLARAATIEGWQAWPILQQVVADPARVAEGRLGLSEFRKRLGLVLATL